MPKKQTKAPDPVEPTPAPEAPEAPAPEESVPPVEPAPGHRQVSDRVTKRMAEDGVYRADQLPEGRFQELWDECTAELLEEATSAEG